MKHFVWSGAVASLVLLIGCSSKEQLTGKRDELFIGEVSDNSVRATDTTPVEVDSGSLLNKDWPQSGYNCVHNYRPLQFSSGLSELWFKELSFESGKALKITAAPVATRGKIFCMDSGGIVYALDQSTGELIWRFSSTISGKDGQIGGSLACVDNMLIVNTSFAESMALDIDSGKIIWRIKLSAAAKGDAITVSNGKAFILCGDGKLQVIDVRTGKSLWSHSGIGADVSYIGSAAPAVDNGVVYVAYPSGEVYALLEENGTVVWHTMISKFSLTNISHSFAHPRACPVVKDGVLYVTSANARISAYNTKNGSLLWQADYGGVQTPLVSGNSIFLFNAPSELVCLNRFSGKKRWSTKLTSEDVAYGWYGQLLLDGYIAMLSPNGYLSLVSTADGKIERVIEIDDNDEGVSVNPIAVDGVIYIQSNCGRIAAYK